VALVNVRLRAWLALFLLLLGGGVAPLHAQEVVQASEARVKAAFLFKFGDYVEWPAESFAGANDFTIGVLGADDLAGELSTLVAGRNVAGRPVTVRRLRPGEALRGVQVLFVAKPADAGPALASLSGQPTLVVTDSARGLPPESVINFVRVAERLRFDVSLPAARARGLKVSSRLLVVARKVVPAT
jgi:hypothetical protein